MVVQYAPSGLTNQALGDFPALRNLREAVI